MNINSDINILGSIANYDLIINYLRHGNNGFPSYTNIKTTQSFGRYERAINSTLLKFKNTNLEVLLKNLLEKEGISINSLLLLFWNSSVNNDFLHYLNSKVFFPALYSGRISIKKDEIIACIRELRSTEIAIQKWTDSTINVSASKYLSFLVKMKLMEGNRTKKISNRFIDDNLLIIFVYWLLAIETKPNILVSKWLQYCLMEKQVFIERITQKKFSKYFTFQYSGDNMKIEPVLKFEEL